MWTTKQAVTMHGLQTAGRVANWQGCQAFTAKQDYMHPWSGGISLSTHQNHNVKYKQQLLLEVNKCGYNKKLSYRRGTTECVMSVEICQLSCNSGEITCTTSPEQIEVIKLKRYSKAMCNKHVQYHDEIESLSLSSGYHKQTDDGRLVDITRIPTT